MSRGGRCARLARCAVASATVASVTVAVGRPAFAGGPDFSPPIVRYRLANGLTVVLAPDTSLEEASVVVHYDVGSADDPPGKEGLAHLVEHLMFDGSRHVGPGEYARGASRAGATNVGGTTTFDGSDYFATVPPSGLPMVFWLESDRMGFLLDRLNPRTLDTEKSIIADETRDRIVDQNLGLLGPAGWIQLFPAWHPYRRDQLSLRLPACTLDDVRAFWRTWYSPSNATIAVAGHFDEVAVRALIERDFGDLPSAPPPARPTLPSVWRVHDVRIQAAANVPHDVVTFSWKTPALDLPGDPELDLAAAILVDPAGRLQNDLVARGLAISVSARESSWRRGSVFWISAVVAEGAAPDDVVAGIDRAVRDLGAGVLPEECKRARDEWFDRLLLGLETSNGRAGRILRERPAGPWELDKYDSTGPSAIAEAVRTNLNDDGRVVVVVHHDPHYPGQGVVLSRTASLP
jgi:zinc protease